METRRSNILIDVKAQSSEDTSKSIILLDTLAVLLVDFEPDFIGPLPKFIYHNIKYPALAKALYVRGQVTIGFILEVDGSITNIRLIKGLGHGCDEEAIKLVQLMSGKWNPARLNGEPRRYRTSLNINFPPLQY